jgi:hypothetical protein
MSASGTPLDDIQQSADRVLAFDSLARNWQMSSLISEALERIENYTYGLHGSQEQRKFAWSFEAVRLGDGPFRHISAVRPSADSEAIGVGFPAGENSINSSHFVLEISAATVGPVGFRRLLFLCSQTAETAGIADAEPAAYVSHGAATVREPGEFSRAQ